MEECGLVHVEDVAAFQGDEGCIGTTAGHLFDVFRRRNAALGAADEKGRAGRGEKILPMIAAEKVLGSDHLARFEGEGPTFLSLAEGIGEVEREAFSNFGDEIFAGGRDAGPGKDEADVIGNDRADIFDDERVDSFGMTGGKLEGIDAAEGATEEHGSWKVEVSKEGFEIPDVVGTLVGGRVAGMAVAALVKCDDAPSGREERGKRSEGGGFHQVAMESDENVRVGCGAGAGIEIRKREAVVLEGLALKAHCRGDPEFDRTRGTQANSEAENRKCWARGVRFGIA